MTLTVESWCEALESGKYKQGRKFLRKDEKFCCLGVACDLSELGHWRDGRAYATRRAGCATELLNPEVADSLGLQMSNGAFEFSDLPQALRAEILTYWKHEKTPETLAGLNDNGVPFPLIAKVIRARPKGLFREEAA